MTLNGSIFVLNLKLLTSCAYDMYNLFGFGELVIYRHGCNIKCQRITNLGYVLKQILLGATGKIAVTKL